ncbi:MAG: LemA family protein [Muribaculaceae bacterium]|nr:LemA family protein [Muribaculaceae bacterium]
MMIVLILLLAIILVLVVVVAFYIVSTQRSLVNLDENCKNALSQIEVQLNSRWDALLALAKTASQYAKHESETLINVIKERRQDRVITAADVNQQRGELADVMGRLMAISESYPDLKANDLFVKTMEGVQSYEENVRMSRMVYNDTATRFNRMVRQWPSSFVAGLLHFSERDYLTTDEEQKKSMPELFA